jgi:probable H4MPT-linked C1 transfer pathway protein
VIVLGWDIGGSNTKVCRVDGGRVVKAVSRPFEVKNAPDRLAALLQELAAEAAGDATCEAHAVTMTAELSRNFLTKREGVGCVLDAVESALHPVPAHIFTVDGTFISPAEVRRDPLRVAAANWMATAVVVSSTHADAVLVDIGTTTTDIIPIVGGRVVVAGCTDPDRLASGELLYTGAVRTPVEALAADVCVQGRRYTLAAEGFATSADVHLWRGDLTPGDITGGTADGRPATRSCAADRLARALCGDRELMDDQAVTALADALAGAQESRVSAAIARVTARHPSIRRAVVAGAGAFIAARAARHARLDVSDLSDAQGDEGSRCAPAAAVGMLLARQQLQVVVKVGGSLLSHEGALARLLERLDGASSVLIVPGGGPFADAVREAYGRGAVDDEAAHWMAVLAMDQYAELLIRRMPRAVRVTSRSEVHAALASGRVPVLAPSRWLREADPLPHSWDVTSDSIAAWVTGQVRASTLVLVKAPGATGQLTDAYFEQARSPGVTCTIVAAGDEDGLATALGTRRV